VSATGGNREGIDEGYEVWRGLEFFEFIGFIGLKEQRRVKSCVLLAGGNSINTINGYAGLEVSGVAEIEVQ